MTQTMTSQHPPTTQLVLSFLLGIGISFGSTIVFGKWNPMVGMAISVGISILFAVWTRRHSRRLYASIGHAIVYGIINFILELSIYESIFGE